ncbi:MAG: preprotein translocase subunit SecG, partial [Deltaproteobacteria bacterium RBG_16_55_12]
MITLVTIIHILVSIGLILVVLLQTGKGADMGAVF